jgi:hypothetical protein
VATLIQRWRDFWFSATAPRISKPEYPEVIVHDPAAQHPHDLDDPFFDSGVQSRVARVIANNASTKQPR